MRIPEPKYTKARASTSGWQRRPELDQGDCRVWESLKGELYIGSPGQLELVLEKLEFPKRIKNK